MTTIKSEKQQCERKQSRKLGVLVKFTVCFIFGADLLLYNAFKLVRTLLTALLTSCSVYVQPSVLFHRVSTAEVTSMCAFSQKISFQPDDLPTTQLGI